MQALLPTAVLKKAHQKTGVVCPGVASLLNSKTSGRRNMLGSVAPERNGPYLASTVGILAAAAAVRGNINVQCPYRLPITSTTHDADCQRKNCILQVDNKKLYRIAQQCMKQMSGYFGGYISKKQKLGQYECKKSISALPLLKAKFLDRKVTHASHQLSHVVNRMFTKLESKGILRMATEEFMLAAN